MARYAARYLYSTTSGDVFASRRTGLFADAGSAMRYLSDLAAAGAAAGSKADAVRLRTAQQRYLRAVTHLHGHLMAVPLWARDYIFRRALEHAQRESSLNGLVGLLASSMGHFFAIGDLVACR